MLRVTRVAVLCCLYSAFGALSLYAAWAALENMQGLLRGGYLAPLLLGLSLLLLAVLWFSFSGVNLLHKRWGAGLRQDADVVIPDVQPAELREMSFGVTAARMAFLLAMYVSSALLLLLGMILLVSSIGAFGSVHGPESRTPLLAVPAAVLMSAAWFAFLGIHARQERWGFGSGRPAYLGRHATFDPF